MTTTLALAEHGTHPEPSEPVDAWLASLPGDVRLVVTYQHPDVDWASWKWRTSVATVRRSLEQGELIGRMYERTDPAADIAYYREVGW